MFHFIWFKRHMFWYYVAYVYIVYIDGLKYIGKPFTVKNSPWKKRDISLGPCLEKMTAR